MASRELGVGSLCASRQVAMGLVLSLAAFGGCGGGSSRDPAEPGAEASPGAVDPDGDGPLEPTGPRLPEGAGPSIAGNAGSGEDGFVADERTTPGVLSA